MRTSSFMRSAAPRTLRIAVAVLAVSELIGPGCFAAEPEKPKAGKPETVLLFEPVAAEANGAQEKEKPLSKRQIPGVDFRKVVRALDRRLNPGGLTFLFKRIKIEAIEGGRIRVAIPSTDPEELARIERKVLAVGTLEFRILADNRRPIYRSYIQRAEKLPLDQTNLSEEKKGDEPARLVAWWVPVAEKKEADFQNNASSGTRWVTDNKGRKHLEVLVVKDPYDVTGEYLKQAALGVDVAGRPCVSFVLSATGAQRFSRLTGSHLPDKESESYYDLGIILDGKLVTAPRIQSMISERGEITGNFTKQQVDELADVLNAGALPVALRKVSPEKEARGKPGR